VLTAVSGNSDARTVTIRIDRDRRRTERSGTDPAFAARVLARQGHGRDVLFDAEQQDFRFRFRTRRDGGVSLISVGASAGFTGLFAPSDRIVVAWSRAGRMRIRAAGSVRITRPGVPVLLPTDGPFMVAAPAGTLQLLSVCRRVLDTVPWYGVSLPTAGADAPLGLMVELRESIHAVASVAADDAASRRRRQDAQVAVVESVLRTFGQRTRPITVPSTVELAVAFLETCYERPVSIKDISGAIGVSVRTLQTWFAEDLGTTPTLYLLHLRLDRAHAALLSGDHRETSVAEIGRRCGFRHMGRFSAHYFHRFTEYPGQTLRDRHAPSGSPGAIVTRQPDADSWFIADARA